MATTGSITDLEVDKQCVDADVDRMRDHRLRGTHQCLQTSSRSLSKVELGKEVPTMSQDKQIDASKLRAVRPLCRREGPPSNRLLFMLGPQFSYLGG